MKLKAGIIPFLIILSIGLVEIFCESLGVALFALLEVLIYLKIPFFQGVRGYFHSDKPIASLWNIEPRLFRITLFIVIFLIPYAITNVTYLNVISYYVFCMIEDLTVFLSNDEEMREKSKARFLEMMLIFMIIFATLIFWFCTNKGWM